MTQTSLIACAHCGSSLVNGQDGIEKTLGFRKESLMHIGPGTIVTMTYAVKDENGEVLDDVHQKSPVKFAFGDKRFPRALMAAMAGLSAGDEKSVTLPPERAFGERLEDAVIKVKAEELPYLPAERGEQFARLTDCGARETFTVLGFVGDRVILDPNHPWAGKTLSYEIKVMAVEAAATNIEKKG